MAMLQDLDRIVGHHKMAYLGGEPNDDAGADTTSPSRTEGAYHTCPPMWSDCSHCTGLAQVDEYIGAIRDPPGRAPLCLPWRTEMTA